MDLNTKLTNLNDLYCMQCANFLNPPIMLMKNAENICGRCFNTENTARSDYTPNFALENIIKNLMNPCRYKSNGCGMQLSYTEIALHETVCNFRKHKCVMLDCLWSGALENLLDHFELSHNQAIIKTETGLINFTVDIGKKPPRRYNLLVCNNELFYLVTYINCELLCFALSYIRLDEEIPKFEYCIEEIGDVKGICFKRNDRKAIPNYYPEINVEAFEVDLRILRMCNSDIIQIKLKIFGDATVQKIDENILSQLECPICNTYMFPPINQCLLGHSICNKCRPKLGQCPTCRGKIENTRNYALEALTMSTKYPCFNRSRGCSTVVPGSLIKKHEHECKFQSFPCLIENCRWTGKQSQLLIHLAMEHEMNDQHEIKISLKNRPMGNSFPFPVHDNSRTMIAYGEIFKINYKYSVNATTWWSCKVVGLKNRNKFKYDIIYCNENQDCQLIKSSVCHVFTRDDEFFDKCLNFTQSVSSSVGNVVICKISRQFEI